MNEYGALGGLVATSGSIVAAATAVTLAFKGRARWEPAEEDIPQAPAKVAGLLTAVAIVVIYVASLRHPDVDWLLPLCIGSALATLGGLFTYVFLIKMFTFDRKEATSAHQYREYKIIGGLRLKPTARLLLKEEGGPGSIQELFEGAIYDKDRVWTRTSQAFAQLLFLAAFLALQVFGSLALASAAFLLDSALEAD
jgi:hypothetical protein